MQQSRTSTPRKIERPPFYFQGVTSRVLPLRASSYALQQVCDSYLNLYPDEIRFEPLAPYVLLTILNYGRMSSSTAAAAHYGWVAQDEVYFNIPLAWRDSTGNTWTRSSPCRPKCRRSASRSPPASTSTVCRTWMRARAMPATALTGDSG